MKKTLLVLLGINLLIWCHFLSPLKGQALVGPERSTLAPPVDIPIFLAGNFGEPRANHFHSGIDIKTNGATGIPVKAIADGYVSRIKVEAGGYGKAIYIRHINGFTSLYGHLLSFNKDIDKYVISEQYRRESFAVDLFPESAQLQIIKGQIIALSGNSGSSEGPHLHFELRETQSENPINPLVRSIGVKDAISPVIDKLYVYSLKDRRDWVKPVSANLTKYGDVYRPSVGDPIPLDEISGIGIETHDLLDGSENQCGVYKIQGYLDDNLFFESCLDEFSFAETRYVNSFMDYRVFMSNRKTILKLFIDPNNQGTIYRFARNRGRIEPKEKKIYKIRIVVEDAAGNQSVAVCNATLDPDKFRRDPDFIPLYNAYFNFEESNSFKTDGLEVILPPGALYDDIYFEYEVSGPRPGSYSPLHQVHREDVPVHLFYRLAIEATNLAQNLRSKATIAQYLGNKRYTSLGGTWEGNLLVTRTRNFGSFCIMVDTIKPVVAPMNFSSGAELKSLNIFKFTVKDDFSGVQSYRGEIDGKWILLEYDLKNSLLEYHFDPNRIKTGIQHKMVIRVADQMGNTNSYNINFFR
ncbi:MAG: peptidoglycan DD-metalloendopeptidase family protein [Bacteroidia bacterium]|nr:peptidoglycan DD-metalloendopeptidase family protein [Bacteroidia bacterium]